MAASAVAICNSALAKIGAERISALSDQNERARLCNEQYEKIRDELLRSHPWNFALKRIALSADATEPVFDWDNRFALPADCLRVLRTDLGETDPWKIEGRFLVCNNTAVSIQYVFKETDTTKYDANFSEALACKLAADICFSIVQNAALRAQLLEQYEQAVRMARSFDGQEGLGDRVYADSWLNSRY